MQWWILPQLVKPSTCEIRVSCIAKLRRPCLQVSALVKMVAFAHLLRDQSGTRSGARRSSALAGAMQSQMAMHAHPEWAQGGATNYERDDRTTKT
jgi:hypothetical protein